MAKSDAGMGQHAPLESPAERLSRLPAAKRRELEGGLQSFAMVCEGAFTPHVGALPNRDNPKDRAVRKLRASDWVEDPVGRYYSDFDLLVAIPT